MRLKGKSRVIPYQILVIVVVDGGGGEKGRKQRYCFWRLLIKTAGPRALAGAALIDLLPLGHSSCSMLCRSSYLQCELPLPSSQATLQHPGSSTNCPHSVVAYAQRDVPMHSRPKLHAPATQVPRQDPASTTCPRTRRPALRLVRSTILPAAPACLPSSTFQHPFRTRHPRSTTCPLARRPAP